MVINVDENVHFMALNAQVRDSSESDITINGCIGQRYICNGLSGKRMVINGTPGNALGAYLNGCEVIVHGNAQDATGDTMNSGKIVIYGNAGDATGYAMRGGRIYVKGNTGYRAGIHMKAYMDFKPVIVVGGRAGSFLGEYQAGGIIVVLGQNNDGEPIINNFCGTGMHGGKIYLRCEKLPKSLPKQVSSERKWGGDIPELVEIVKDYCNYFPEYNAERLLNAYFYELVPNSENPYKQMYTNN
ncbi:MAG: glutamate synthase [Clostridia bacterium]|nr:glutamate synthase [Clostridia bacterium]